MTRSIFRIEVSESRSVFETSVDEMLYAERARELIEADTPVYLGFFADGKTVGICEDVVYALEGPDEGGFMVWVSFIDSDVREGG